MPLLSYERPEQCLHVLIFHNLYLRARSLTFSKCILVNLGAVNALLSSFTLLHMSSLHKCQSITALLMYRFVFLCFQDNSLDVSYEHYP